MFARLLLTASFLVATVIAQSTEEAVVKIEASHGGAGNGLTNTTIEFPLNTPYHNSTILEEVSTLFLTGATGGLSIDSITCTPFKNADGTGDAGKPFTAQQPSLISTNTVQLGSIVCISTGVMQAPGVPLNPSSSSTGSATANHTSTLTTKQSPAAHQSTVTSTSVATASASATPSGSSQGGASSTSASPSQSTGNAASSLFMSGGDLFGGLALAGFGLAFAL